MWYRLLLSLIVYQRFKENKTTEVSFKIHFSLKTNIKIFPYVFIRISMI